MLLICRRWSLLKVSPSSWVGLEVKLLCIMLLGSLSLCIHILLPNILLLSSSMCGSSFTHDADDEDADGWNDHKQNQRCN